MKTENCILFILLFVIATGVHEVGHVIAYLLCGYEATISCNLPYCSARILPEQIAADWGALQQLQPLLVVLSGGGTVLLLGLLLRKSDELASCILVLLGFWGIATEIMGYYSILLMLMLLPVMDEIRYFDTLNEF